MAKIAIITGASRGLGRNMAVNIARKGSDVIITYRSRADLAESAVSEIKALGRRAVAFQLDSADLAKFPSFARRLGQTLKETFARESFDHLVHNAGDGLFAPLGETTEAQFDQQMNLHVKGVFFLTQALLPLMADSGSIVTIGSGLTRVTYPGFAVYTMAKAAADMMAVCMARELGPRGIRVNSVAPGAIETDFGGGLVRDNPDVNKQFAAMTALGRVGVPDDIGPMVASLLSEDNRWVTGQRIEVSGGQMI
ncbi:SDR family oxidoreductase [Bradyrhizobium sp. I71]|uniref:SDR family NAD(P)-dependent oxidoreductase n=1 Tax=Bradyrhizobium sp. I71 TaxID=2590772 RepID=UPI001EF76311|nr:SDR family oxidoreductase [Bradyrhizobium sp. I71]ULK98354.1 SDR family oxidoreductase [Bradyrhizobium sp. I71]